MGSVRPIPHLSMHFYVCRSAVLGDWPAAIALPHVPANFPPPACPRQGFLFPLFREEERRQNASGSKRRSNREARALAAAAKTHLPIRLVDYFVAIGMDVDNTVVLAPRASDFIQLTPVPTPVTSPTAGASSDPHSPQAHIRLSFWFTSSNRM